MVAERTATLLLPIPSRESSQAKALRLLVSGRVRIRLVRAGRCWATVNGDTRIYKVGCSHSHWHCECAHVGSRCSHILAVQSVVDLRDTGDRS